jgi:hypothetical protein
LGEVRRPGSRHDGSVRGAQTYRFVVRGSGVDRRVDVVEPTAIRTEADLTVLTARIEDQSHLRGVLNGIGDIGLQLVSFERLGPVSAPSVRRVSDL